LIDRILPDWSAPANVRGFTTTRSGGVSEAGYASLNLGAGTADDPAAVAENRRRFEALLPAPAGWLRQVHGARVLRREAWSEADSEADAVWSATPGLPCTILTADCLPVLFCDREGQLVAAAHAGWRGLALGVLEATIAALPVPAHRLLAWIGPGIGVAAYEVGEAFQQDFQQRMPWLQQGFETIGGQTHADLALIARAILERAGVSAVHGGEFCTYTDAERFYSHRRHPASGRMATTIWLQHGRLQGGGTGES